MMPGLSAIMKRGGWLRGLGLEYFTAATNDDFPVMLGITVLVGTATVVGNLLADVTYAVLDPSDMLKVR